MKNDDDDVRRVLPALMNEYRVPEINVQNGVLKSIGVLVRIHRRRREITSNAIANEEIEERLMDRDTLHRQTFGYGGAAFRWVASID